MLTRFRIMPVTAAVLLAVVANGPVSADTSIKEQVTVAPGRQISPQEEAVISSAAVKVLRHISAARGELQGDKPDTEKAGQELAQTEKLLDIIQAALPTTRLKDRIWLARKHLEYEDSQEVLPDLVPIYAGLDESVSYMPTAKAKGHRDPTKQALEQGDKAKAKEQLEPTDDALVYMEADLPLSSTRHLVTLARAELGNGDAKAADRALLAAEDNVVFVSIPFRSDLTQAKAALWRAWRDYNLGNKEYAKGNLDEAVGYLVRAAKSDDAVERRAAADLVVGVRDLHQLIDADDKDFGTKVEISWRRLKALSERSAEYLSIGWQRLRAEGAGKEDLIEAKLQLAYGRIDHLYSKDDQAARVDLAEAKGYLDAAVGQSAPDVEKKVQAVDDQVQALENGMDRGDSGAGDAAAFQQTEAQLATLIRQR